MRCLGFPSRIVRGSPVKNTKNKSRALFCSFLYLIILPLIFSSCVSTAKLNEQLYTAYELIGQNDLDGAFAVYTDVLEKQANNVFALSGRAYVFEMKGDFGSALEDLSLGIVFDETNSGLYYNRGNVYFKKNDYENALRDFNSSIGLDGDNAAAYLNRANTYVCLGLYSQAIVDYEKYLGMNETSVQEGNIKAMIAALAMETVK